MMQKMMKRIISLVLFFSLAIHAGAYGWHDFHHDFGDGYTISRFSQYDLCISHDSGGSVCGPVNGYFLTDEYFFVRIHQMKPMNRYEGDTHQTADGNKQFYFVVKKGVKEDAGPLSLPEFEAHPVVVQHAPIKWIKPRNPNLWLAMLWSVECFVFASVPRMTICFLVFLAGGIGIFRLIVRRIRRR